MTIRTRIQNTTRTAKRAIERCPRIKVVVVRPPTRRERMAHQVIDHVCRYGIWFGCSFVIVTAAYALAATIVQSI